MSVASEAIADLDGELAETGQPVSLKRLVANADDLVRGGVLAFVRGYRPDELVGGIQQGESLVVLSPTGMPAEFVAAPLRANDRIVTAAGRSLNVQYVEPVQIGGVTVRINVVLSG